MSNQEKQKEIDDYLEQVKLFKEVRSKEAEQLIEAYNGSIIYIGRETCTYCRRFVRKLSKIVKEHNVIVHYVYSKHPDYEEEIEALRNKYNVPTVPGLIYSSETAGLIVKCDSSLSPDEITKLIEVT